MEELEFDDILVKYVGEFGRYQILIIVVFSLGGIFECFYSMEPVFTQYSPEHWCKTGVSAYTNCSQEEQMQFAIPMDSDGNYGKCEAYAHNYSIVTDADVCGDSAGYPNVSI